MLSRLLDGPASWCSDRPAIVLGERTIHTWATLAEAVSRRSAGLRTSLGVAPGQRVVLFAANCPEYIELLFSIWHAGAVAVPVNSKLHPREAAELAESSGARICFAGRDLADGLMTHLPERSRVVVIGERVASLRVSVLMNACEPDWTVVASANSAAYQVRSIA